MLRSFKQRMTRLRKYLLPISCCFLLAVTGCATQPKSEDFLQPVSLQERSIQTRIYPAADEIQILNACADLLLDNGFRIIEVESRLGWIEAVKMKAVSGAGFYGARASVVTYKVRGRADAVAVRVIFFFRRKVEDPAIYQEFFLKLSQAVFIEAEQI